MKTYYKVVRVTGEQMVSALVGGRYFEHLRHHQRRYGTDQWTTGYRGTPVLAFDNLSAAQKFAAGLPEHGTSERGEVWRAQVRHPRKINRVARIGRGVPGAFGRFWRAISEMRWWALDYGIDRSQGAPDNTVACDAVRLVERI